jgi:hypothetical protein
MNDVSFSLVVKEEIGLLDFLRWFLDQLVPPRHDYSGPFANPANSPGLNSL